MFYAPPSTALSRCITLDRSQLTSHCTPPCFLHAYISTQMGPSELTWFSHHVYRRHCIRYSYLGVFRWFFFTFHQDCSHRAAVLQTAALPSPSAVRSMVAPPSPFSESMAVPASAFGQSKFNAINSSRNPRHPSSHPNGATPRPSWGNALRPPAPTPRQTGRS